LIEHAGLNPQSSKKIAFVVHSNCDYFAPVSYPAKLNLGLAIKKLGKSSIVWTIGLFQENDPQCKAVGEFVHVFVDRESGEKCNIPADVRAKLLELEI
jgi:acyl-CoA thioester hydrolase